MDRTAVFGFNQVVARYAHDDAAHFGNRLDGSAVASCVLDAIGRLLPSSKVHHANQDRRRDDAEDEAIHDVTAELSGVQDGERERSTIGDVFETERRRFGSENRVVRSEVVREGLDLGHRACSKARPESAVH